MNGCDWRLRVVMAIDVEVKMRIIHINIAKKPSVSSVDSRSIASRIQQIRNQKKDCEIRVQREQIEELRIQFCNQAKQLGVKKLASKNYLEPTKHLC